VNRTGLPEAFSLKSGGHGGLIVQGVSRLRFGWWDVADRLQQPAVIEPVDLFERRRK
jgi:hypothetical protein